MELNKTNKKLLGAIKAGYYTKGGEMFSPYRKAPLKVQTDRYGYKTFTFQKYPIHVHRVVAYQKYGNKIFDEGLEVRHLDGNNTNNFTYNIGIGTHQNNMMDIDRKTRINKAVKASTNIRRFSDKEMSDIRNFHNGSYKETMGHFNITSKGTLHYILNTDYVTKK